MTYLGNRAEFKQTSSVSQNPVQILVVEDDDALRKLLLLTLTLDGYHVLFARNGREALTIFSETEVDFVLLDVDMPFMDGLKVCIELRKKTDVPIIMITANSRTDDIITGMELGADHYMTKPFVLQELHARIRATLRRVHYQKLRKASHLITYGDITLNEETQQVIIAGEVVALTPNEYRMLSYLMHNPNKPVSKEEILRAVWEYHPHEDLSFIRVTMRRLRSKVEKELSNPQYLKTLHGLGYQFCTEPQTDTAVTTNGSSLMV